jgi:hypothetical protein
VVYEHQRPHLVHHPHRPPLSAVEGAQSFEPLELDSFEPVDSFDVDDSLVVGDEDEAEDEPLDCEDDARPFAGDVDDVDDRESVMYQPLPLKTMPTG